MGVYEVKHFSENAPVQNRCFASLCDIVKTDDFDCEFRACHLLILRQGNRRNRCLGQSIAKKERGGRPLSSSVQL